ncbi:hypothetical protein EV360DRAFT_89967 [Lentinula raphanica]|nr:hypothetical protein EV360DRAFT_89967 [Lentinula raphanica]
MTSGENVGDLSARCQKVVDDANAGQISAEAAREKLQAEGISGSVLQSFLVQLQKPPGNSSGARSSADADQKKTPEGLNESQREEFRKRREEILGAGLGGSGGTEGQGGSKGTTGPNPGVDVRTLESNALVQQLKAIQRLVSPDNGSISASTLDSLPHLREKAGSTGDQHIDETLRTKKIYLKEQSLDGLVDLFQSHFLIELLQLILPGFCKRSR